MKINKLLVKDEESKERWREKHLNVQMSWHEPSSIGTNAISLPCCYSFKKQKLRKEKWDDELPLEVV